mmetsp:Transcript_21429/g.61712  ORF Transcript_21429/g.61712 Transcript_21429/m.61712 type:complete len:303 (-) Transcript_21429:708-1616(-)
MCGSFRSNAKPPRRGERPRRRRRADCAHGSHRGIHGAGAGPRGVSRAHAHARTEPVVAQHAWHRIVAAREGVPSSSEPWPEALPREAPERVPRGGPQGLRAGYLVRRRRLGATEPGGRVLPRGMEHEQHEHADAGGAGDAEGRGLTQHCLGGQWPLRHPERLGHAEPMAHSGEHAHGLERPVCGRHGLQLRLEPKLGRRGWLGQFVDPAMAARRWQHRRCQLRRDGARRGEAAGARSSGRGREEQARRSRRLRDDEESRAPPPAEPPLRQPPGHGRGGRRAGQHQRGGQHHGGSAPTSWFTV